MKCKCTNCGGDGFVTVECEDCDGGTLHQDFLMMEFLDMENKDVLYALQSDARTAVNQTNELIKLNPSKEQRYREQLAETIAKIEKQAEELIDDED